MRNLPSWPAERSRQLQDHASGVAYAVQAEDVLVSLEACALVVDDVQEIASAVIEWAVENTTITQKALAEALGVPASTLRGLRGGR